MCVNAKKTACISQTTDQSSLYCYQGNWSVHEVKEDSYQAVRKVQVDQSLSFENVASVKLPVLVCVIQVFAVHIWHTVLFHK